MTLLPRKPPPTIWQKIKDEVRARLVMYADVIVLTVALVMYVGMIYLIITGPPPMECYTCDGKRLCVWEHPSHFKCEDPKWDRVLQRGRWDPNLGVGGKIRYFLEDVGNKITGGGKEKEG